jgi:hypothetical protein
LFCISFFRYQDGGWHWENATIGGFLFINFILALLCAFFINLSAKNGHLQVVKWLVGRGADTEAVDNMKTTGTCNIIWFKDLQHYLSPIFIHPLQFIFDIIVFRSVLCKLIFLYFSYYFYIYMNLPTQHSTTFTGLNNLFKIWIWGDVVQLIINWIIFSCK